MVPPRPTTGASRPAEQGDRELLLDWLRAFAIEALGEEEPDRARNEQLVDHRLGVVRRDRFVLWDVDGQPVSLAGFGGSTPNGSESGLSTRHRNCGSVATRARWSPTSRRHASRRASDSASSTPTG